MILIKIRSLQKSVEKYLDPETVLFDTIMYSDLQHIEKVSNLIFNSLNICEHLCNKFLTKNEKNQGPIHIITN